MGDTIRDILMWTSIIVEKGLYAFEICIDGFNAVNYAIDATKFAGTVVIDNWSEPVKETVDIWNTLVGNVPYLDDWQIPSSGLTTVEKYVQMIVDSIEGSL